MRSRAAIPWCLAATGFLASLTVFTWQGKRDDPGQQVLPPAAVGHRLTPRAAPASPEAAPTTLILPLAPATQPEPVPNVQPLPDDAPTVDDVPTRRGPPESPEGE